MDRPQFEIPGYDLLEVIGSGGMSTVYRAVQQSLGRTVALKVMTPLLARQPEFAERFLREGRIVAQLVHPGIVTVHDIGHHGDVYFLTQEYLPGGTLKDHRRRGMSVDDALFVVRQAAEALHYAHEKGFVHRDVKPENILFRSESSRDPVLTDFGIAKALRTNTGQLTVTGAFYGSPGYFSPEQAAGREIDGRTDLYSLGVVLYELLTGSPPFVADETFALAYKHLHEPAPPLVGELAPLQPILDRLLAKDREARYATAGELAQALDGLQHPSGWTTVHTVVNERPVADYPSWGASEPPAGRRNARSRRLMMGFAAAVGLAVGGAAVLHFDPFGDESVMAGKGPSAQQEASRGLGAPEGQGAPQAPAAENGMGASGASEGYPPAGSGEGAPSSDAPSSKGDEPTPAMREEGPGSVPAAVAVASQASAEELPQAGDAPRPGEADENQAGAGSDAARKGITEGESQDSVRSSRPPPDARMETATDLLAQAREHVRALRLTAPAGDNAYEYVQKALALAPESAEAERLLDAIAAEYKRLARRRLEDGKLAGAGRLVERGLRVRAQDRGLLALRTEIEHARVELERAQERAAQAARIDALLAGARQRLDAGSFLHPPGDNAHELLQEVLALDPTNRQARHMSEEVLSGIERSVEEALARGDDTSARALLRRGLETFPGSRELARLAEGLADAATAKDPEADEPQTPPAPAPQDERPRVRVIGTF